MCGWQVKLCDPLVTDGPYLTTLEMLHAKVLYKFMFALLTLLLMSFVLYSIVMLTLLFD